MLSNRFNPKNSKSHSNKKSNEYDQSSPGLSSNQISIIDGDVPVGNILLQSSDQQGKQFTFSGDSKGTITLEKSNKIFGNCELEIEPIDEKDMKQPSWNA